MRVYVRFLRNFFSGSLLMVGGRGRGCGGGYLYLFNDALVHLLLNLTYLAPRSRVLLVNPVVLHLVKKLQTFHETRR
jgi:hypothetical protein